MRVTDAIAAAERILPGRRARQERRDPRWQAIIKIGEFNRRAPRTVWTFIAKWGCHSDRDLRAAVGTCLLEHLLEYHFEDYITLVEDLAARDPNFADTVLCYCSEFGRTQLPQNRKRLRALNQKLFNQRLKAKTLRRKATNRSKKQRRRS